MEQSKIAAYGKELYDALHGQKTVAPLTERESDITIEDAYAIQMEMVRLRMEQDGDTIIGKKIGATSKVVQGMLDVNQPDFGHLLSSMAYNDGAEVSISNTLIQEALSATVSWILIFQS